METSPIPLLLCQVQFLDGAELCYEVDRGCTGQSLLQHVFNQIELVETVFFGLQYQQEGQLKWIDPARTLKKQFTNYSKLKHVHFYFRVKFYPPSPSRCTEEFTRYLFYLQIKLDLFTKRLPCSDTTLEQLCALGIQAELGDFDPYRMGENYVQQFRFTQEQSPQFFNNVSRIHSEKTGVPPSQAELIFLSIASKIDYYGMNCCSARRGSGQIQVAVSHFGLSIFEKRILHEIFPWRNILRINSRRNKFNLVVRHQRTGRKTELEFKLSNTRICKEFWQLARDYHAFFTSENSTSNPANHTPSIPIKRNTSSSSLKALLCLSPPSPGQPDTSSTSLASSDTKPRRNTAVPAYVHTNSASSTHEHSLSGNRSGSVFRAERTHSSEFVSAEVGGEDVRGRTGSFDRALDRFLPHNQASSINHGQGGVPTPQAVQRVSSVPESQFLKPKTGPNETGLINEYEELDEIEAGIRKNKAKALEKKRSLTDLPPPLPVRERTSSLGISSAELIPSPFLTPTPTPHGVATARRIPVKIPPQSPSEKSVPSITHQFSTLPLPPPRPLHYSQENLMNDRSNPQYSIPRLPAPPSYKQPPLIVNNHSRFSPARMMRPNGYNKDFTEGSHFTVATRSLSSEDSSSSGSREANFEPEEYNAAPNTAQTQFLEMLHNRQESMESNSQYQSVPAREEIKLLLHSDVEGRYGFNIQGKERNQDEPVIVSRVMIDSPASRAYPTPVMVGDELMKVNNHSVQIFSHHQLVKFIKSGKDLQTEGLELVVRRKKNSYEAILQFSHLNNSLTPSSSSRHLRMGSYDSHMFTAVSRSSVNYTPSTVAPSNLPPLTLPQSIELIAQSLQDGSYMETFLSIPPQPTNPTRSTTAARYPDNFKKNRYKDILPYDDTRVQLSIEADYINASQVEVAIDPEEKKFYLVTQGPLKHTCKDFWCLVWDQGCTLIVMLTSLKEGGKNKCYRYWPELADSEVSEKTAHYEGIEVTTMEEHKETIFTRRKLRIRHQLHSGERFITQLHYTAWPDQGVPAETNSFLSFVGIVRRESKDTAPIVHCSAGIGRSGVHIVMDIALTLIEKGLPIDLVGIVWQLRECRGSMVQNLAQYEFICRAVLAAHSQLSPNDRAQLYKV